MATSFGALCTDFYINSKLAVKMDLPADRETLLHMFERLRKSAPRLSRFRRFDDELALESSRREAEYQWVALRRNTVRTGHVNPESMAEAYRLHRLVLEAAPHFLTISPLDVDYLELLYGFDLECESNHDAVVMEALFGGAPVANLLGGPRQRVLDVQPIFGFALSDSGDTQAFFEVKTRPRSRRGGTARSRRAPINVLLTVRQYGPVTQVEDLQRNLERLVEHGEQLATEKLVPDLLMPIARHITSGSA